MLWYKAWLDTRVRFLVGIGILAISAFGIVLSYPKVVELLRTVPAMPAGGTLADAIAESAALASTYRGYIWSQWLLKNLPQLWCLFALSLGTGSVLSQVARGGGVYTLSLPVSRQQLVLTRAGIVALELLVLAVVPPLLLPVLSPLVGQSYAVGDAVMHGVALFAGGFVIFAFTFLLASFFTDTWRPLLLALATGVALGVATQLVPSFKAYSLFRVMSAETYFKGSGLPWVGMTVSLAASAAMVYGAVVSTARRDF